MKIDTTPIRTDLSVNAENNRKPLNFIRDLQAYSQQVELTPSSSPSADNIELTPEAREMQALERSIAELPDVDMSKIAAILKKIESGQYAINEHEIANKMIQMELETV